MLRFKQYPFEHNVYGFKSGKTEFEIELLYENSLAHTESNTEDTKKVGGIKKVASMCGAGPKNEKLEF